jgi:mRNA interferase RelE/StbE
VFAIEYHEDVEQDFKELGYATTILVLKKIEKIAHNPQMGKDLGNRVNMNLSSFKKIYVDKKRVRIIYKIIENKIEIFVIAIGKRDDMEVYQKASNRNENS